jgi:pimeloyl-ACP methyl ester carboxylesterase
MTYSIVALVITLIIIFIIIKKTMTATSNIENFCVFQGRQIETNAKINIPQHIEEIQIGDINALLHINKSDPNIILYLHGNAGNIYDRIHIFDKFKNYSMLMIDYHGYGKTHGKSTENIVKDDALKAFNYLKYVHAYDPSNIIIYGNSLGASIGAWLTSTLVKKDEYVRRLIMQAGFCCYKHIALDTINTLTSFTMSNKMGKMAKPLFSLSFNSEEYVKQIGNKVPILIMHSPNDEIINIKHSKKLRKCNSDADFYKINGTHNNLILDKQFMNYFNDFIG